MEIDGLLLCSKCENQLKVDIYSKEFGFYKVYPCKHCVTQHWILRLWIWLKNEV